MSRGRRRTGQRLTSRISSLQQVGLGAAGHELNQLVQRELGLTAVCHHPAACQNDEAVTDGEGVVWVVCHQDDRDLRVFRLEDQLQQRSCLPNAQRGRGFVEDQQPASYRNGSCDV